MSHCSISGCTDSWRQPVVQPQAGNVLKIRGVVGHEGQVVDQGDGGNHQVRCRHRDSLLKEATTHLAKLFRTSMVVIQHLNVVEQVGDVLEQRRRIGDVVCPCIEFPTTTVETKSPPPYWMKRWASPAGRRK